MCIMYTYYIYTFIYYYKIIPQFEGETPKLLFTFQSQIKVSCHSACGTLDRIHNTSIRYLYQNVTRGAFVLHMNHLNLDMCELEYSVWLHVSSTC